MPRLTFATCDVFTDRRFGGNQLAVVFGADDLPDTTLQAIAREFNYAETSFVLPPADPAHDHRVRIFTPGAEVPFAGHPNVGTACVLAWQARALGRRVPARLHFEELAGLVEMELWADGSGATLTTPRPAAFREALTANDAAALLGLAPGAIALGRHGPMIGGAGMEFLLVELTDASALAACAPDAASFGRLLPTARAVGCAAYVRDPGADALEMRMFAPLVGVAEDSATGSAAAALAGLLAWVDRQARPMTVRQGRFVGRPSTIRAEASLSDGVPGRVRIGGACVPVMQGWLDV